MKNHYFHGLSPNGFHKVSYREWGRKESGRTIVCVHGLTRNAHDFSKLGLALSEHARIIAIDIVGRGDSDWLADPLHYALPQYCADMNALIARLDTDKIDWVGTSLGGLIGITLASQINSPIQRMVLNDVGPFVPHAALKRISSYITDVPTFPDMTAATAWLHKTYSQTGPMTDEDFLMLVEHSLEPESGGGWRLRYDPAIALNFNAIPSDLDLWPLFERITCPTLVLRGARSDVLTFETAEEMLQRGHNTKLITIPDIGHYPALMNHEQIEMIKQHLEL